MSLTFEPITLDRQHEYRVLFDSCNKKASDYSFINLWGWRDVYGLEWAWDGELCWLRQTKPDIVYWSPVGPVRKIDWTRSRIPDCVKKIIRIPDGLAEIWKDKLGVEPIESREHWDYLYSVPELVKLSGNRFHKKKNLLKQFKKLYNYDFNPLTTDCVEEVLEMQDLWMKWRDKESAATLGSENDAIYRVLQSWDQLEGISGGAIRVDGMVVAYTVADALEGDTVVIHFEKGQTMFKGVYQAINQMYLEHMADEYEFVNREQDLGDEGLRKAKMSYNPVGFVEKFSFEF